MTKQDVLLSVVLGTLTVVGICLYEEIRVRSLRKTYRKEA
jgi:hypothetical protein